MKNQINSDIRKEGQYASYLYAPAGFRKKISGKTEDFRRLGKIHLKKLQKHDETSALHL